MTDFETLPLTLGQVRRICHERMPSDFPDNERKSPGMIVRALQRGEYACWGAVRGEEILAYAFFVVVPAGEGEQPLCLFDYLAVRADLRGTGVGSRFLRALSRGGLRDMACVLLEIEDPDRAETEAERVLRERRRGFYLRAGLEDTGVTAWVFGADYRLLEWPLARRHAPADVRALYACVYRSVLPAFLYRKFVRIPPE